jgi:thiol-disulfide isomerase/thioredoxin/dienelactone hydrolase
MSPRFKRRLLWALLPLLLLIALTGAWYLWNRPPPDIREYSDIQYEWHSNPDRWNATDEEKKQLANRCLDIASRYPGSVGGLAALIFAATTAPDTLAGKEAYQQLAQQLEAADIGNLAAAFDRSRGQLQTIQRLAPAILARVKQIPEHPRAARLLAAICSMRDPGGDGEPTSEYKEAADLIASRYADSPDIAHFCEGLGGSREGPSWAGHFEQHLRTILQQNRNRWVRCMAKMALADLVQHSSEDRQPEAETLFEEFRSEFDGKHAYRGQMVEGELYNYAADRLRELRVRALGKAAPEIAGIDLDDRPITLSEYRGRVVLLNFWATWCMPCMKLIPHELELAARFQGQPFTIVGVNCDTEIEKARAAVALTKMTWRSFRDHTDQGRAITSFWNVLGYPTLYLLDHHGIIRKRWVGAPSDRELVHTVGVLISAAQRQVPLEEMKSDVAALRLASAAPKTAPANRNPSGEPPPGTGFLDKVYQEPDGSESKYVVFIPHTYDGSKLYPAILYLHGAGLRGTDGWLPLRGCLAAAIQNRNEDFPFIAIFPQAHKGESWAAGSAGGERAVAILNQVMKDYRIDADRVTLTGMSMGGEGTWSLAAADPQRWAAIVPICGGGNKATAARLKDVPCWCFHGDADKVIPIQESRKMIQAIKDAGGRPLFQELSGIDHNSCANHAYAIPDLMEWLLLQSRRLR